MKKRLAQISLIIATLFGQQSIHALRPVDIQGTSLLGDNIRSEYKYGMVRGMVSNESFVTENRARFAPKSKTKELLEALFNTTTDFDVTRKDDRLESKISASHIGGIINYLYNLQTKINKKITETEFKKEIASIFQKEIHLFADKILNMLKKIGLWEGSKKLTKKESSKRILEKYNTKKDLLFDCKNNIGLISDYLYKLQKQNKGSIKKAILFEKLSLFINSKNNSSKIKKLYAEKLKVALEKIYSDKEKNNITNKKAELENEKEKLKKLRKERGEYKKNEIKKQRKIVQETVKRKQKDNKKEAIKNEQSKLKKLQVEQKEYKKSELEVQSKKIKDLIKELKSINNNLQNKYASKIKELEEHLSTEEKQQIEQLNKELENFTNIVVDILIKNNNWLIKTNKELTELFNQKITAEFKLIEKQKNIKALVENLLRNKDNFIPEKIFLKYTTTKLKKNSGNNKIKNEFIVRKSNVFSGLLFGALDECNFWGDNKKPIFEKNTVLDILHSFVNKKINKKSNLTDFFQSLCTNNLKNTNPINPSNQDAIYSKEELQKYKLNDENEINIEKVCAAGTIQNWSCTTMPNKIKYLHSVTSKNSITFPNCTEAMLQNLSNIMAFDGKNFSSAQLAKTLQKEQAPKKLKRFYDKYGNLTTPYDLNNGKESVGLQTSWLDNVLETNIPYMIYNCVVHKNTKKIKPKEQNQLFFYIPEDSHLIENIKPDKQGFYNIILKGKKYRAFTKDSNWLGYDMQSYTESFIIVANHIFELELFKSFTELEKTLQKDDFEKKYIQKLFKKLNMSCESKWNVTEENDKIDKHTITTSKGDCFVISFKKGKHSELTPKKPKPDKLTMANREYIGKNKSITKEHTYILNAFKQENNQNETITSNLLQGSTQTNEGKIAILKRLAKQQKNKSYMEMAKNIFARFCFAPGDWRTRKNLIMSLKLNNKENGTLANIIIPKIKELHIDQIEEAKNKENIGETLIYSLIHSSYYGRADIYDNIIKKISSDNLEKHIVADFAKPDSTNNNGLMVCARNGCTRCLKYFIKLLEKHKKIDALVTALQHKNYAEENALIRASKYGSPECLKIMIDALEKHNKTFTLITCLKARNNENKDAYTAAKNKNCEVLVSKTLKKYPFKNFIMSRKTWVAAATTAAVGVGALIGYYFFGR